MLYMEEKMIPLPIIFPAGAFEMQKFILHIGL